MKNNPLHEEGHFESVQYINGKQVDHREISWHDKKKGKKNKQQHVLDINLEDNGARRHLSIPIDEHHLSSMLNVVKDPLPLLERLRRDFMQHLPTKVEIMAATTLPPLETKKKNTSKKKNTRKKTKKNNDTKRKRKSK
jgi:hypothetical protein